MLVMPETHQVKFLTKKKNNFFNTEKNNEDSSLCDSFLLFHNCREEKENWTVGEINRNEFVTVSRKKDGQKKKWTAILIQAMKYALFAATDDYPQKWKERSKSICFPLPKIHLANYKFSRSTERLNKFWKNKRYLLDKQTISECIYSI